MTKVTDTRLSRDDTGRVTSDYEPTPTEIEVCRDAICREFGNNGTDGYYIRILKAVHAAASLRAQGGVSRFVEVGEFIASSEHGVGVKWGDLGPLGTGDKIYALSSLEASPAPVSEPSREQLDEWLSQNCGNGIPYNDATDEASMLHGLAYVLRQIEASNSYRPHIGQVNSATSSLRMSLDHFARAALAAKGGQ